MHSYGRKVQSVTAGLHSPDGGLWSATGVLEQSLEQNILVCGDMTTVAEVGAMG